jgi:hypothetical protein
MQLRYHVGRLFTCALGVRAMIRREMCGCYLMTEARVSKKGVGHEASGLCENHVHYRRCTLAARWRKQPLGGVEAGSKRGEVRLQFTQRRHSSTSSAETRCTARAKSSIIPG